ncbi:MAG: hypothetical protein ABGX16_08170 [Pirellulales bacterium]
MNRSKKQRRAHQRELKHKTGNADKSHANSAKREIETAKPTKPKDIKPKLQVKKTPGPLTKLAGPYAIYIKWYLAWVIAILLIFIITGPGNRFPGSAIDFSTIGKVLVMALFPWGICATLYHIRARACPVCGGAMLKRETHMSDRASPNGRRVTGATVVGTGNVVFFHLCRNCDIELLPREIDVWKYVGTEEVPNKVHAHVETEHGPNIVGDIRRLVADRLDEEYSPVEEEEWEEPRHAELFDAINERTRKRISVEESEDRLQIKIRWDHHWFGLLLFFGFGGLPYWIVLGDASIRTEMLADLANGLDSLMVLGFVVSLGVLWPAFFLWLILKRLFNTTTIVMQGRDISVRHRPLSFMHATVKNVSSVYLHEKVRHSNNGRSTTTWHLYAHTTDGRNRNLRLGHHESALGWLSIRLGSRLPPAA